MVPNQITFGASNQQHRNDKHNFFQHIATIGDNFFEYASGVQLFLLFIKTVYLVIIW